MKIVLFILITAILFPTILFSLIGIFMIAKDGVWILIPIALTVIFSYIWYTLCYKKLYVNLGINNKTTPSKAVLKIENEINGLDKSINHLINIKDRKYLYKIIFVAENIKSIIRGKFLRKTYSIILTSKRVVMVKSGTFRRLHLEIPLETIDSISQKQGKKHGEINIWRNFLATNIKKVPNNQIIPFTNMVNIELNNYKNIKTKIAQ